jgi:hypothetical protein
MLSPLATRPDELSELLAFLRERFNASADVDFLRPEMARWKYFAPGPEWESTRSFVLRLDDGGIAAHAYACPIRIWNGERWLSGFHVGDRAGSPKMPGASLFLAMLLTERFDLFLGIGGNADARRIARADRVVAKPYGVLRAFSRTLRPFHKLVRRQASWMSPLRLGRDLAWNLTNRLPALDGWTACPVQRFGAELRMVDTTRPPAHFLPCLRTPALLNYMLDCPTVGFAGFLLQRDGVSQGHLLLSGKGAQAHLAELWIDSNDLADWSACYGLAARCAAGAFPAAESLDAVAFPPFIQVALGAAGFREYRTIAVSITDKQNLLRALPLFPHLNLIDSDGAYLF